MTGQITITQIIILALCGVILWQQCASRKQDVVQARSDTSKPVIVYVQQPPVQVPTYQPPVIISQPGQNIPPQYTTQLSSDVAELSRQLQQLAQDFYAVRTYRDSVQLHDSSGRKVGSVQLADIVSENRITSRSPSYQLNFPHSYQTITVHPAPKRQVYAGLGITGSQSALVQSLDAGLIYKDRKDRLFTAGLGIGLDGKPIARLGTAWKIRLGK